MSEQVAEELGRRLRVAGFRPLPDVDADGRVIGTRLWRVHDGYVEYLVLRPNGLAHAVRAVAAFDHLRPTEHGPVTEHRSGYAVNAFDWLLTSNEAPTSPRHGPMHRQTHPALGPGPVTTRTTRDDPSGSRSEHRSRMETRMTSAEQAFPSTSDQHEHPLDALVPDPSGMAPLCDEQQFAAILNSMVADEAPRLFAVVQEYGERVDARIAAWASPSMTTPRSSRSNAGCE